MVFRRHSCQGGVIVIREVVKVTGPVIVIREASQLSWSLSHEQGVNILREVSQLLRCIYRLLGSRESCQ